MRFSLLLAGLVSLISPARAADIPNAPLPELTSEGEDKDWADLVLGTHSIARDRNGYRITVRGTFRGERVGFEVATAAAWKAEGLGGKIPVFIGRMTFRSIGAESDAFVRALAVLYKQGSTGLEMKNEVGFDVISLEGDPRLLETQKISTKVFYESDNKNKYAEAYANFDLPSKKFYFKEKDPDYRSNLLQAFKK